MKCGGNSEDSPLAVCGLSRGKDKSQSGATLTCNHSGIHGGLSVMDLLNNGDLLTLQHEKSIFPPSPGLRLLCFSCS